MAATPRIPGPARRHGRLGAAVTATTLIVSLVAAMLGIRPAAALVFDSFRIDDASHAEGTGAGTTAFTFNVHRSSGTGPATVNYTTANGTATAPADYTAVTAGSPGTVSFATNETDKQITINVVADSVDEADETFTVTLTPTATGACDGNDCTATGTILDDDGPGIYVDNAAPVAEGDPSTTPANKATFGVHLTAPSPQTVTVQYAATSGTATVGTDVATTTGTLTFSAGDTDTSVDVSVIGDTTDENDETFFLTLSSPSGGSIQDGTGDGSITDDDGPPVASIGDVSSGEQAGVAHVPVHLSAPSGKTVTVSFSTADGTATAGDDYTAATAATATFAPGVQDATADVTLTDDTIDEVNETFTVTLNGSPTSTATIDPDHATATATIVDNDPAPVISIGDAAVTEKNPGDAPAAEAVFTVSMTPTSGSTVTVQYTTTASSATAGEDYTTKTGTLTFAPGSPAEAIRVPITADTANEATETFFVDLSAPTGGAGIGTARGTATITDDDPQPTISIADVTANEGNAGTTPFSFDVTLSAASGRTVTVNYATANDSATTADGDYASTTGTLTFAPGEVTKSVVVNVTGDTKDEQDETFRVNLSSPAAATIADVQAIGTITDDDPPPTVSIDDVSVTEGSSGSSLARFTVTITGSSFQTITVPYATADGTATSPSDYTSTSGSVVFNPGDTASKQILVTVNGDTTPESDETFTVHLSAPTPDGSATIAKADGVGTILTDDAPTLVVNDVTHAEGNTGTTTYDFTVTRSGNTSVTSTVHWTTVDDTAVAASDYTAASDDLTFGPGVTTQHIIVNVSGDSALEPDEAFKVVLSSPTIAAISDGEGIGTITNDDVTISISDPSAAEGNTGTSDLTFKVTLSAASASTITVAASTANGTAAAPGDYTAFVNKPVTFAPGVTTQDVVVKVNGDGVTEPDETVLLNLTSPSAGATIADSQGTGTITNDDAPPAASVDDVTVTEGDTTATFTVTLSNASASTVTVNYATSNGTATAGSDYTAASGTLTFAPNETTKQVAVTVKGDTLDEANETFNVTLSSPTGATVGDGTGVGTITDDDAVPVLSIADASATEGNTAAVAVVFTVTLAPVSGRSVTVGYSTADGTATAGSDYTAATGTLTFAAGETSKQITVNVPGDTADEANETFTVTLAGPTNATLGRATATGTINDDDEPAPSTGSGSGTGGGTPAGQGYSLVGEDGSLYTFGSAKNLGDMKGKTLNAPIVGVQYTPGGNGYWLVAKDGGIFTFGDADFYGSTGNLKLAAPVIGMAATPTGKGYWLFATDGGIFTFGDAQFFGSMGGQKLNQPVINMEPLASGNGYWLVAADGGIFSFGQAQFFGSMGDQKINQPVFDMTSTDTDNGYWLIARDGGVFSFGDAGPKFFGNPVNDTNPKPTKIIGMDSTPTSTGYWIADANGKVWNYGDAQALGDRFGAANPAQMIGFSAVPALKP